MKSASKICALAAALALPACGMHADPPANTPSPALRLPKDTYGGPGSRQLNILLGDTAPIFNGHKLQHLNIGVTEIDTISNGQATVLAQYSTPRVVDVLAHQDDNGESIANSNAGRTSYQGLRIVVDLASSSAVVNDQSMPINFLVNVATSSSVGAGAATVTTSDGPGAVDLVVTQPFSVAGNGSPAARVDFNAFESIALDTAGNVLSRASLFVAPVDEMGHAGGYVYNQQGGPVKNATVVAIAPDGSVGNTSFTDADGHFRVGTLRAGSYQLMIYNSYITAAGRQMTAAGQTSSSQVITGPQITITAGRRTAAGTITD